jgi:hypothetical protein
VSERKNAGIAGLIKKPESRDHADSTNHFSFETALVLKSKHFKAHWLAYPLSY